MTMIKPLVRPLIVDPTHHAIKHYYDEHPTEEDLMGESVAQRTMITHLESVVLWYSRDRNWFIASNLNLYSSPERMAYPIAPDLAIFTSVALAPDERTTLRSWRLYRADQPPPDVVFEAASESTWELDLTSKPAQYAAIGVREYYAYDPNMPPVWTKSAGRLRGWHRSGDTLVEQPVDALGRIWSTVLDSWLVPDGVVLHLVDARGVRRLTEGEAERAAKQRATRRAQRATRRAQQAEAESVVERAERELATARAALAAERAEREAERAEHERRAREYEAERAERAEREAEREAERAEREAERAEREAERAEREAERAEREAERAEREAERAERERLAKEAAWTKLREAGLQPDDSTS